MNGIPVAGGSPETDGSPETGGSPAAGGSPETGGSPEALAEAAPPSRGPRRPRTGTPSRRPGSLRRTTTHTSLRPDGLLGDVHLTAAGRDLWTGPAGQSEVRARATVEAVVEYTGGRQLRSLRIEPHRAGDRPEVLQGRSVASGLRKALAEALPGESPGSLRYQLLDDLPTAVLVSGYAMGAGGLHIPRSSFDFHFNADVCAGWATGASLLSEADLLGRVPHARGPVAPSLACDGDDGAWHEVGPMSAHAMRRWRRLDVWRPASAGPVEVEAFFRDSHVDVDGVETVVHEYLVSATLEPSSLAFRDIRAEVAVLPWPECPSAAASAGRLIGSQPGDLRTRVRADFTGTSTCTHLNDTLRSLACLPDLVGELAGATGTAGT